MENRELIYGFQITIKLTDGKDPNQFLCRFLSEAIEANGLSFGGSPEEGFVVALDGRTTENHRELVKNWLRQENVTKINVGELVNASL